MCVCAEKDNGEKDNGTKDNAEKDNAEKDNRENDNAEKGADTKDNGNRNESSVAVAAEDRYSIILYYTWVTNCLQPLLHPHLLYTFSNRACLESHLSYIASLLHCLQSHLSYILHILVCVCVCLCVPCLHFQEAGTTGKHTDAIMDDDDEPPGPYFPAVRKAIPGSRAAG